MAVLSFKVQADYEKVVKLREEIAKLETQLKSFGKNTPLVEIKAVETRLAEAKQEFTAVASEAAKAGAIMDKDFKTKIRESTKSVDDLTAQIIEQKAVIRGHESDVKKLGEAYRKAMKNDSPKANSIKEELDAAKFTVEEQKGALFELTQEKARAQLATKKLKDEYAEFKEETKETAKESNNMGISLGKIAGLVGGITVLKQFSSAIVQVRGQFQEMETSIKTLVGDEMTAKLLPQIKELAKTSPLTMTDIVGAEKMMLGFNIEADKTIDYLKALSDVSMGNSQKFNSLTLAFSQMSAAGKLMGQDLNQMINAGFNPLQQISKTTGKSIAQLKTEMSKGAISAQMVQQAFLDATAAGGKFYNMSENASKTINGQISMMQDAMDAMFNEIGTKSEGVIMKGIKTTTSLIQNYETVGKVLSGLVITFGAYKAAIIAVTAFEKAATLAKTNQTIATWALQKAQEALNKTMLVNPFVAFATVMTALTVATIGYQHATDYARKSQRELNKNLEESQEAAMGEIRGLAKLKGELSALEKGSDEYNKVKDKIVAGYSKYHEGLAQEIEEVGLLDETYKKLTQSITSAFSARQYDKFMKEQEEGFDKNLSNKLNKLYNKLVKQYGDEKGAEVYVKLRDTLLAGGELDEEMKKTIAGAGSAAASGHIRALIGGIQDDIKAYEKIQEEAKVKFGVTEEGAGKPTTGQEGGGGETGDGNYAKAYAAAKKQYETDLKAFKEVEKDKSKFTVKEYEERQKKLQSSEEAFKKLGGKTEAKEQKSKEDTAKAQENALKIDKKIAKERRRQQEDLANQLKQLEIDAEADRSNAVQMQRELDNTKEIQQLERQKEDYIDAFVQAEKERHEAQEAAEKAKNKDYIKKSFDENAAIEAAKASEAYQKYDEIIRETREKQTKDQLYAEEQANLQYLSEYGNYLQKKEALTKIYADKINKATTEGEKKTLEAERDKLLRGLDQSLNSAYQNIFKDPTKMSLTTVKDAIKLAREEIKKITDKGALNEDDLQNVKILQEALERLQGYVDSSPFAGFGDGIDGAVSKLNQILAIQKKIEDAKATGNKKAQADAEDELEAQKELLAKNLAGVGVDMFTDGLSMAAQAMEKIAEISGDPNLKQTADILNGTANVISSTAQGAATGGWIGALVGGVTSIFSEVTGALMDMQVAVAQNRKAMDDYALSMKLLALSVNEEAYDTLWGESVFGKIDQFNQKISDAKNAFYGVFSDRSKWERQIIFFDVDQLEQAQKYVDSLRERSDVSDVEFGYMDDKLAVAADFYVHKAQTLANAIIRKKGDEETTLGALFPDLFDASGNLKLDKIEEAKLALQSLNEMTLDENEGVGLLDEALKYAELVTKYQEQLRQAAEDYMGSIGDSIGDAIVNGILKGEDALKGFGDVAGGIIEQIARDFASSWMIENYLKNYEQAMQDAFASGEAKDITSVVQSIVAGLPNVLEASTQATKEILDMTAGTDYDLYAKYAEAGLSQQSASSKGYETISEDTGNELVGRATAQYESNLRMEGAMRDTKDSVDIMAANQVQIRDIAAESRALIADSYLELQQIRENTGAIIKPIKNLSDKIDTWNDKIMGL